MEIIYTWIGFVIFWLISFAIGLILGAVILMYLADRFQINQFKYMVVLTERYRELFGIYSRLVEARRWFSSFTDLQVIYDHIIDGKGRIEEVRSAYARTVGRDVYNKPLEAKSDHQ